jgi:Zn-finger nucleic acid-binding protein
METEFHFGARLDLCRHCGGVWLDAEELEALAQRMPEELAQIEASWGEDRYSISVMSAPEREMLCPDCHVELVEQPAPDAPGTRFDDCMQCGGVWVGGGKLRFLSHYYDQTLEQRNLPPP